MSAIAEHPDHSAANAKRANKRQRLRLLKRVVWGVLALVAAGAVALSLAPKPVAAQSTVTRRGDLLVFVEELAKTRVRDRYVVSAPTAGELLRIELRPGDAVHASKPVATILPMLPSLLDPRSRAEAKSRASGAVAAEQQARAAVTRAELAREHANQDLERTRALVQSGSLPPDRLRDAELEARMRTEELTSARYASQTATHEAAMVAAALRRFDTAAPDERFDVTTPAEGRVLRVIRESAGVVSPGTPLIEVGDPARLEVVSDILTADAVRVRPGAKVTLLRWGGDPLDGHVRVVEPAAFTRISALGVEEQRVSVIVDLDAPPAKWAALGDGYRVEARIVVDERKNVLSVPLGAVFRHDGGWATYAVRGERARRVAVEIGARSDSEVEIKRGLEDGDRVIVHPSERIADGVAVTKQ